MQACMNILIALLIGMMSASVHADIYKWTDAQGQVHFSDDDSKRKGQKAETVTVRVNSYEHVTYTTVFKHPAAARDRTVLLYGTSWCGYCRKARAYFQAHNIPYSDFDIENNAQARAEYDAMKAVGVPVILVGQTRMNGFSEAGFEKIYR
jgi:glutaredoxin